jgi:hypothetical protein
VSSPAARDVARKQAVAKAEITEDIVGTESENIFQNIYQRNTQKDPRKSPARLRQCTSIEHMNE